MPWKTMCQRALPFVVSFFFLSAGSWADQWEHLWLSPPEGISGEAPGWSFSGTGVGMTADRGVVELRFDFSGGGAYAAAYREVEPPRALDRLSFRMKKPTLATIAIRVVDSVGQTFHKSATFNRDTWQAVEVDLRHWHHSFGGPNDGRLRQPIHRIGFLLERDGLTLPEGVMKIAEASARQMPLELALAGEPNPFRTTYPVTEFDDREGFQVTGPGNLSNGLWRADLSAEESVFLEHSISLHGQPEELRLTVRGGNPGNRLRLHLGSHFQFFVRDLGELSGGEVTLSLPVPPEGWDHCGGQDDGVVRLPLRFARLELRRAEGPAEPTEIELEKLECVTEVTPASGLVLEPVLVKGEEAGRLRLIVGRRNLLPRPMGGRLEITASDWNGGTLKTEIREDLLAPGIAEAVEWDVPLPAECHFVEAAVRFLKNGETLAERTASFTRPPDRKPDRDLRPGSPWGMGVYLYRYPNTPEGLEQMETAAAMASRAGLQWSREEFSWWHIETEPGVYDFSFHDKVVDAATRNGISIYGLLAYWSRWTEPYTERGIGDFADYTRAVVRRYKDRIRHWEIYNEPNIFFWQGPKELYPELLKRCHQVIREEDPEAKVLGLSTSGIDLEFIRMCLEAEAPFDILTVHPYRGIMNEAQFMAELREAAALVGNRPVWITEMGLPTHQGGLSERNQALFLARSHLAALASGVVRNISWYNFRNDGTDPFHHEHNFGVVRHDLSPKPAYRAAAMIALGLKRGPWSGQILAPDLYALRAADAVAVWSGDGTARVKIEAAGGAEVYNLMGEKLGLPRRNGRFEVELEPFVPVFVVGGTIGDIGFEERPPPKIVHF